MNHSNSKNHGAFRWVITLLLLFGMFSLSCTMYSCTSKESKTETTTETSTSSDTLSQASKVDPEADKILKQMSDHLTATKQFSYNSKGTFEVVDKDNNKQKQSYNAEVFVKRPNMLRANVKNEKRNASVFYDGKLFTVLGRNANMYAQADAPPTLDAALDSAREKFLMDPPGSDILYSDLYSGLMEEVTSGKVVGEEKVNGKDSRHLAFTSKEVDWEIWVQEGDGPVPLKYKIISKNEPGKPEFVVEFSDWKKDAVADQQFVFTPPAKAKKIPFMRLGEAPKENQPKK